MYDSNDFAAACRQNNLKFNGKEIIARKAKLMAKIQLSSLVTLPSKMLCLSSGAKAFSLHIIEDIGCFDRFHSCIVELPSNIYVF